MADDGMPPPLEDMSETLEQARRLRDIKLGSRNQAAGSANYAGPKVHTSIQNQTISNGKSGQESKSDAATKSPVSTSAIASGKTENSSTKNATTRSSSKGGGGDFGGMKKGFLFGGTKSSSSKPKTDNSNKPTDSMPFIQAKSQDKQSGLKMDEVQQAMESTKGFLQNKDWVTEDLLEKVQKNPTLGQRITDPRFMQAVTEFQTNPQAAMAKYQNNPEMQQFLKEFCGLLGDHFSAMGGKEDTPSPVSNPAAVHKGPKITEVTEEDLKPSPKASASNLPVDPHVQQILADPANQEILMDPKIQQLIESLRTNPEKAQRMLREGDSTFRQKVDRLISLGLLKFQS